MSEPRKIIRLDQRTGAGDLRVADLLFIKRVLSDWGYVLLPSDTCYALATYAAQVDCEENLNRILRRDPDSISLCAADFRDALRWIDNDNLTAISLLAHLAPGPITVVCEASELLSRKSRFFQKTLAAKKGEIGIRISDSLVERQVSGTSDDYLISSTAVRRLETREPVTDFDEAFEIVSSGMSEMCGAPWAAIEGRDFGGVHSTVVRAFQDGTFEIKRPGALSHEEIDQAARTTPPTLFKNSARSDLKLFADQLKGSTLLEVDAEEVNGIIDRHLINEISDKEAFEQLRSLQDGISGHLIPARASGNRKSIAASAQKNLRGNSLKITLFVALEEELDVLTEQLNLKRNAVRPIASGKLGKINVDVLCPREMGRVAAAVEVTSYLTSTSIRPDFILCVGLAGGFQESDVDAGAVICADKVIDLANRKVTDDESGAAQSKFRRQDFDCSRAVYSVATSNEFNKEAWEGHCRKEFNWPKGRTPSLWEGKIASVDEVVASDSHRKKMIDSVDKLMGVEMEAGGVCAAAKAHGVPCGVVRVVSDFADPAKADDQWRRLGMKTLAELVKRLPLQRVIEVANA